MESESIKSFPVLDKIDPIFVCKHVHEPIAKYGRSGQKYLATSTMNADLSALVKKGIPYKATAKVDGTSMLVRNGVLLKRRDQKLDRKGKKKMPNTWIMTGEPSERHGVGYMPLEKGDKWFFDVFERDASNPNVVDQIGHPLVNGTPSTRVRVIRFSSMVTRSPEYVVTSSDTTGDSTIASRSLEYVSNGRKLEYTYVDLSELNGKSFELMGPKIQGNHHSLEFHALMEHGLIDLPTYPLPIDADADADANALLSRIKEWQDSDLVGRAIEGVVLHFESGEMFKLHRHHLDMEWSNTSDNGLTPLFDLAF